MINSDVVEINLGEKIILPDGAPLKNLSEARDVILSIRQHSPNFSVNIVPADPAESLDRKSETIVEELMNVESRFQLRLEYPVRHSTIATDTGAASQDSLAIAQVSYDLTLNIDELNYSRKQAVELFQQQYDAIEEMAAAAMSTMDDENLDRPLIASIVGKLYEARLMVESAFATLALDELTEAEIPATIRDIEHWRHSVLVKLNDILIAVHQTKSRDTSSD